MITIVSETTNKGSDIQRTDEAFHCCTNESEERRAKAALAVMLKNRWMRSFQPWEATNKRAIKLEMKIKAKDH